MLRSILTLFLVAFSGVYLYGQKMSDSELLAYSLKNMDLKFENPRGFEQLILPHPGFLSIKGENELIGSIDYTLKPIGSDKYHIALGFYDSDTSRSGRVTSRFYEYYDNNQLKIIKSIADVPYTKENINGTFPNLDKEDIDTSKIRFFDAARLKKYKADYGGIANVILEKPYLEKYWKIKVLFFYKKGEGEVYQYYFYNDGVPIDKIIKQTEYMLTFRK